MLIGAWALKGMNTVVIYKHSHYLKACALYMPFSFKFLDKEDYLVRLATEASHKIKLEPGQQAPHELFHFQIPSIKAKRMQKKSRRLEESLDQEEELSPKKKKKSTSESTPAVQEKKKKTKPEPAKKDVHVTESVSELAN